MNKILSGIIAAAVCLAVVESLTCNSCTVGILDKCLISSTTTCSADQPNCYTGKAVFPNITEFPGFQIKGCLDSASCNKTETGTILGTTYTVTRSCCSTDKCKPASSASIAQLSLAAGAGMLASLWIGLKC